MKNEQTTTATATTAASLKDKIFLDIHDASYVFSIGESNLRKICSEAKHYSAVSDDGFVLKNGRKTLIHKDRFVKWALQADIGLFA